MSAIEIIWIIAKVLLASAAIATTLTLLIALFHPLKFNLKLRASIRGQRAELWFVYLFRILQIGVIATPHTQDVVVKIFFWKKLIERQQRPRPPAPKPPGDQPYSKSTMPEPADKTSDRPASAAEMQPAAGTDALISSQDSTIVTGPAAEPGFKTAPQQQSETEAENVTASVVTPESEILPEPTAAKDSAQLQSPATPAEKPAVITGKDESKTVITAAANTDQTAPTPDTTAANSETETPTTVATPVSTAAPVDPTPLKPLSQVDNSEKSGKTDDTPAPQPEAGKGQSDSWRPRLRKFKRDLSNRYRQIQKYLRLARQKWRNLAPALGRFWSRGKKAFAIINPALLLRYALHEPYLTGMMQGNMAVFAGLANRFGINFVPVPVFSEPGVYGKGRATAVIRPWRLIFALTGLLLEKKLWQELWLAFQWYRAQKASR